MQDAQLRSKSAVRRCFVYTALSPSPCLIIGAVASLHFHLLLHHPAWPTRLLPPRSLETFANPSPKRDYWVRMKIPEFTCLCPLTGQPDFATMVLDFVPDKRNVELKSLKLYMWSYRNEGAFHEAVTNAILDDLVKAIAPRFMRLTAQVVRARRDFHDRDCRASQERLEACAPTCRYATEPPGRRSTTRVTLESRP